jgi:cilia- and flagella-associated protein 69
MVRACLPLRAGVQVQYGFLSEDRRHEMRAVANAVSTDGRMCKIYSVLHLLGFNTLPDKLSLRDQATLTLAEKYVKFKQGEIWMDIATKFHVRGFEPTAPDRARLQSGVEFSEQLATVVVQDQRRLLRLEEERAAADEAAFYAGKLHQAKLEHDLKFYKKDKSAVSAKEKQVARKARDDMLAASREAASRGLADMAAAETLSQADVAAAPAEAEAC